MSATAEQITAACERFGLVEADQDIAVAVVKHIPISEDGSYDIYSINVAEMIDGLENRYSTFGSGIDIFCFSDREDATVEITDPDGLLQDGLGD